MPHDRQNGNIRMIAVDMDGTLLGADGQISPRNRAALLAAEAAGIAVVVATGRRHSFAMRLLAQLGLHHASPLISSNGSVTRTLGSCTAPNPVPSELIARTHLSRETALWLCGHLGGAPGSRRGSPAEENFRNALVLTFDRLDRDGNDARGSLVVEETDDLNASISRWMTANQPYIEQIQPIERSLSPGTESAATSSAESDPFAPIQAMLSGTIERMQRAEARLLEHPGVQASSHPTGRTGRTMNGAPTPEPVPPPRASSSSPAGDRASSPGTAPRASAGTILTLHRTVYAERNLSILDILPPHCSKGAALLPLAASRNIDPSEILAIGDNWNDLSMFEVAGRAVLMDNAPEDLKAFARTRGWRIGLAHTADGVAEAIESSLAVAACL